MLNTLQIMTRHALDMKSRRQHSQRTAATVLQRTVSGGLLCLAGLGCGSDTTGPAPQDLTTAYWTLRVSQHAITMALPAPYNQVQLTAMPLTLAGTLVPAAGNARYSTSDSTVAVDSLGHITARYATLDRPAQVVVSLTTQRVTFTDTVFVQVDSFPLAHPVATFSIHPRGTTCRESAFNSPFPLPVYAVDVVGDTLHSATVNKVPVYYTSSDPTIATIDRNYGGVTGKGPGTVTFTATALIDGVARQDTLAYILDPSHLVFITTDVQHGTGSSSPTLAFKPSSITVGAGWGVNFENPTLDTVDVVFTDSIRGRNGTTVAYYPVYDTTHTGPLFPGELSEVFFDAGTYTYHSDRFGQSGSIQVQCGYKGS